MCTCVNRSHSSRGKRRVLQEKTGRVFADYLKGVEDSLDNIFSRFQQLAALTPTH